jgi:RNA polymerase sigma-70 factor (ECF subfamily)
MHAQKRGGGEVPLMIEELEECIPDESAQRTDDDSDSEELKRIINEFLGTLADDARKIFMRRYFFGDSVKEIADKYGFGVSKVKMSLSRSRESLQAVLNKEGYYG